MEIKIKTEYSHQIGNVRVEEKTFNEIKEIAEDNDVSMQTVVRAILESALKEEIFIN